MPTTRNEALKYLLTALVVLAFGLLFAEQTLPAIILFVIGIAGLLIRQYLETNRNTEPKQINQDELLDNFFP